MTSGLSPENAGAAIKKPNEIETTQYHSNGKGNGAQIPESYKVKDPFVMGIIIDKNRGSEIKGSTAGVVFEWLVHNVAYDAWVITSAVGLDSFGNGLMNKGRTLDVGSTIYDDSHGVFSLLMWNAYAQLLPGPAIYDLVVYLLEQGD